MGDSKYFRFEGKGEGKKRVAEADFKAPNEKNETSKSTRKSGQKSVTDEKNEEISEKEKGKAKGGVASFENHVESTETEKVKKPERELSKTEKVKSFATKGAAAKSASHTRASKVSPEAIRREKNAILQSVIQPHRDEGDVATIQRTASTSSFQQSSVASDKSRKREAEIMHKQLLMEEQEDQALATVVLDLVKKKSKEKEQQAEILLSEEEIFQRSKNMSALEKAAIISVLEEAVAKLSVLGNTYHKPVVKPEIKYVSLIDKLTQKQESELIDLIKSHKTPEEYENEKQFIKLQKDRGFLEEALKLTLLEMRQRGTFRILQDIVHLEEEMSLEEEELRFIANNLQQELNHCKALLESERRKGIKKLDDRSSILANLKDEIQNMLFYNRLKFKYIDHWERSRAEQNAMKMEMTESELQRQLSDYEEMSSVERRCSAEMRAFIEESIKRMGDTVEELMDKYESEMEERENKLTKLKEEREEHSRKLQAKMDLYNHRQKQIDDWKAFKENRRLEAEHLLHLTKMATRIQAWWRGTMVRRHLGPYRKKKGRKGKKK